MTTTNKNKIRVEKNGFICYISIKSTKETDTVVIELPFSANMGTAELFVRDFIFGRKSVF